MNDVLDERTRADGHKDGQTDRVIRKVRFAPKKERTSGKVIVKVRGYWSVVEIPHASIQQYIK